MRETSNRAEKKFRSRAHCLPRERVSLVLDRDMPYLELSTLCGLGMNKDDGTDNVYGGGSIAGIGFISGVRCVVTANDFGIKGGASHPMGVEKALRIADDRAAEQAALWCRRKRRRQSFPAGGNVREGRRHFANMSRMSAAGIPVISIVHGSSTAGGAYQTGIADSRARAPAFKVFLAGPPLLKAATGEIAHEEALGGAEMHAVTTGLGNISPKTMPTRCASLRDIIAKISMNDNLPFRAPRAYKPPRYDAEELVGIVPVDYRKPYEGCPRQRARRRFRFPRL